MDRRMRRSNLIDKAMLQFTICVTILMLLATPLFYWLTKHYYAEDLILVIDTIKHGKDIPPLDVERDIMHGIMIQFGLIICIIGISVILIMKNISVKLWTPFYYTLSQISRFKLEDKKVPQFPENKVNEFTKLNEAVTILMRNSLISYNIQKEFTENASHEMQTPLAIFQSKLDNLLQDEHLTKKQADTIQDLYNLTVRLTRLNKNLLLLARIANNQYNEMSEVDIINILNRMLPLLHSISDGITIIRDFKLPSMIIECNSTLLESMINNLIVNALRHNQINGEIIITVEQDRMIISNTSNGMALDENLLFNRFYRPIRDNKGNGLGLSIVKAICKFHNWKIEYKHFNNKNHFIIAFK